jgi:hypothetical protein
LIEGKGSDTAKNNQGNILRPSSMGNYSNEKKKQAVLQLLIAAMFPVLNFRLFRNEHYKNVRRSLKKIIHGLRV